MYTIGPHVSTAGGLFHAPEEAAALQASAYALFVKNQRQWVGKPLLEEETASFLQTNHANGYAAGVILPHAGYLINLANPDEEAHAKSMASFLDELHRCEQLGLTSLNIHPGSHLHKLSPEAACDRVAQSINHALAETQGVTIVVENTAGQGAYLGATFAELARILRGVEDHSRIGFCLDTAHALAAGIDVRTADDITRMLDAFDTEVGRTYLRGMHLNDSKGTLGSHLDRHESLGAGSIGWEAFETIVRDPRCENIPLIIETPNTDLWAEEVRHLRRIAEEG